MKKLTHLALLLGLFQLSAYAETNGLTLTLYFPHTEVLNGEWYDYSVTLSNGSSRAVHIRKVSARMPHGTAGLSWMEVTPTNPPLQVNRAQSS